MKLWPIWAGSVGITATISAMATAHYFNQKEKQIENTQELRLPKEEVASHEARKVVPKNVLGPKVKLGPFIVNLLENHYLKVEMNLELESSEGLSELQQKTSLLKEEFTDAVSRFKRDELISSEGKQKLRDELLQRFNKNLQTGKIIHIYFEEFIIQ